MSPENYCIGMDFGTDSVRTIIVNARDGEQVAAAVYTYPIWRDKKYCHPAINQFRQHPLDHIEGMQDTIQRCLQQAGPAVRKNIRAISSATTGSSPVAVDRSGKPLSLDARFMQDPDALIILWKDHTAAGEAAEINAHAKKFSTDYLKYVGGVYSSEWYWAKLLHILRKNPVIREHCYAFVEHADWIPFLLTGGKDVKELKRGVCTAGHKGLWAEEWNGFPPEAFFSSLDPMLSGPASRMGNRVYAADQVAGKLSIEWAGRLGLSADVLIGIGAMDAHMGAVGGQIEPWYLSKVMGTSTCDMLVAPMSDMRGKYVKGICGLVNDSVIPGMIGMEAGQSAFGDVYGWLRDTLAWPLKELLPGIPELDATIEKIIPALSRQAAELPLTDDSELAIDWFNGRRTPDANAWLKGAVTGLRLGSTAPGIFRSLVESTCLGARAIIERFGEQQVPVKGLIGIGGISRKSPFIMQMLADSIGMPIKINRCEQTGALGAAMFAATAAGIYPRVEEAMAAMGQGIDASYYPDRGKMELYERRYQRYRATGAFLEAAKN